MQNREPDDARTIPSADLSELSAFWPFIRPYQGRVILAAVILVAVSFILLSLGRGLAWLVITPSLHWVHHHAIRADTDSTYGTIFSFWDRLFQSTSRSVRHEGQKIGVEGRREAELLALLWRPFSMNKTDPPHS